jgi:class 3 adenylate cyclase/DNA-binding NarL/FixJ family response regulator
VQPERRIIAVLFTDLVHSTEVFSRLSAEAADALRREHFALLGAVVAEHGGDVVKTLGDGVMAVFALATQAVDCAVAVQARCLLKEGPVSLPGMRVGVSVGEASWAEGDFHGAAVIEAARLCHEAKPEQILCSRAVRLVCGTGGEHAFTAVGALTLRGLPGPVEADEVLWTPPEGAAPRVLVADDAVVLRQGIVRLLEDDGFHVVGQAGDAEQLLALTTELLPDVVITDIRMPPDFQLEGLAAALKIRELYPDIGVLVLSQHVVADYAVSLLHDNARGVGYLLKERIAAIDAFTAAVRRVAGGGTAIDPEVVEVLMRQRNSDSRVHAVVTQLERQPPEA